MDKSIILYDLEHRIKLKVIPNAHYTAIKRIISIENGSYIVSIGYDIGARIWAPRNL